MIPKSLKTLFFSFIAFIVASPAFSQGYKLKMQIKNFPTDQAYLSYFFGAGQFYRDTADVDAQGNFTFEGNDTLEHGMYSVISNNKKLFDFLVDDQEITFQTGTNAIVQEMKISGSKENEIFFDYMRFLEVKGNEVRAIRSKMKDLDANSDAYKKESKKIDEIDKEVKAYIDKIHDKHPESLTSNFIYAMAYPTVPEAPVDENGLKDSTFAFRYFKAHFYDNFDWSDERLLRTSTYHEKLDYYLEKLTVKEADSVIESVDYIMSKLDKKSQAYKYTLSYLTSKYERSQLMGMDAVFVHLTKQYFIKDRPEWFAEKNLKKLVEKANALDPLLIGKKAPNIIVKDTAMERFVQLYDVEAKYTIVYIWSPECGHCKEATPKLKKLYDKYRDKGVEVFAVGNEFENDLWKKFIIEYNLDWINGSDGGDFTSNFRSLYDVHSTPQTYLLDKNKKILSKKMSVESLEKILEFYFKKEAGKIEDKPIQYEIEN